MALCNKIEVTAVDNELILLASTARGSSVLCHLKSGFGAPVSYSFNPGHILPPGNYDLTAIGINWGGPWAFKVNVAGNSNISVAGNGPVGVVLSNTQHITTA